MKRHYNVKCRPFIRWSILSFQHIPRDHWHIYPILARVQISRCKAVLSLSVLHGHWCVQFRWIKPVQRINLEAWLPILTKSVLPLALRWNPSLMWLAGQCDHSHWYPTIFEPAAPFLTWNTVITPISHTSINWGVNFNREWYMFRPHKSNHSNFFAEPGF
jgi:hypothetical protein